jgi:hypothetical protein
MKYYQRIKTLFISAFFSVFLLPIMASATCSTASGSLMCTTEAECSEKLAPFIGQPGTWPYNYSGVDCVCAGASNYPYYVCSCCGYEVPSPLCTSGDACCGSKDPCCGSCDECCRLKNGGQPGPGGIGSNP